MILGIDEVGRGPWAGPLVVGAVVLGQQAIDGLTDSKALTKQRRERLNDTILNSDAAVGLGWVQANELDELGLSHSLVAATKRAVAQISVPYHEIIIDGTINFLKETTKGQFVTTMKKADLLIPSVSAASIVAKVARDQFMEEQDILYPEYGFKSHVGYGTARHREAIANHGVTPLHRLSFAPLEKYRSTSMSRPKPVVSKTVSTKHIGDAAEEAVANYLMTTGHEIVARNWKTKFCEIDIVSQQGDTTYFTEVKYRKTNTAGGGAAAITPKKVRQMTFAAELYSVSRQSTANLRLAAASVKDNNLIEFWMPL